MHISPFSREDLLPKEETLEVQRAKSALKIGILKEISFQEKRICLTPDGVSSLISHGHQVIIEKGAGEGSNFSDEEYILAGAEVTHDVARVFDSPILLKIEPPTESEIERMNEGTILFSALQLKTRKKEYFEHLMRKKITAFSFEFLKDRGGSHPAVRALSEIAGNAAILIASELMISNTGGKGLLFGNITGVAPTEVVIIGAGSVGEAAARTALGLGANVKIFDNSIDKLHRIQNSLPHRIFTSTIQPKILLKALRRCDVAIGALKGKRRAPIVVTETMVEHMKKDAVIIDVCIDSGGCFETSEITSHEKPTFIKNNVIHYCVPNITSRYSKTASMSISNILTPILIETADNGGIELTIRHQNGFRNGIYLYRGIVTNREIGEWFQLPHSDINLIMF